jgi:4-carboxymuconolactone decarboxylase
MPGSVEAESLFNHSICQWRLYMAGEPTNARKAFGDIAPRLAEITDKVLFGDVWEDDALSPRERSLVTITNLVALYRHNELGFHLKKGIENGLSKEEIIAVITHTAFYAGWPTAMTAIGVARDALKDA